MIYRMNSTLEEISELLDIKHHELKTQCWSLTKEAYKLVEISLVLPNFL